MGLVRSMQKLVRNRREGEGLIYKIPGENWAQKTYIHILNKECAKLQESAIEFD